MPHRCSGLVAICSPCYSPASHSGVLYHMEGPLALIGGIARKHRMTAIQVGGIEDHIHALILAPPTIAPSQIAQYLKGDSSKWIHEEFSKMRGFEWQDGYGGFTVSKSQVPDLIEYIKNQREHHRKKTFQEEYLGLLKKHGVDYDKRYLWG